MVFSFSSIGKTNPSNKAGAAAKVVLKGAGVCPEHIESIVVIEMFVAESYDQSDADTQGSQDSHFDYLPPPEDPRALAVAQVSPQVDPSRPSP